jgi:hypothetical protein
MEEVRNVLNRFSQIYIFVREVLHNVFLIGFREASGVSRRVTRKAALQFA